jgi:hypothetical protein
MDGELITSLARAIVDIQNQDALLWGLRPAELIMWLTQLAVLIAIIIYTRTTCKIAEQGQKTLDYYNKQDLRGIGGLLLPTLSFPIDENNMPNYFQPPFGAHIYNASNSVTLNLYVVFYHPLNKQYHISENLFIIPPNFGSVANFTFGNHSRTDISNILKNKLGNDALNFFNDECHEQDQKTVLLVFHRDIDKNLRYTIQEVSISYLNGPPWPLYGESKRGIISSTEVPLPTPA